MMKVKLTYFKPNGTYHSSCEYYTEVPLYDVRDEIEEMKQNNNLPGVDGHGFIILANVEHEYNVPIIIPY